MIKPKFKRRAVHQAVISVLSLLGTLPALADSQAMDLGTVSATGGGEDPSIPSVTGKGTATYEAPGSMSINATEPVFNINQHYLVLCPPLCNRGA
ncbi:MAG: hypothetical protein HO274_12995 [Ferrovum myxofaciens]|uniref:hypothetical protein n=1 Tax=Ferrovum myxofaciens TaxID=416213 RepID=UPI0023549BD6|nr:hypothetical protein [Ferrovum myxofaciens]QKE42115.1 MAG: hypothetical protein HO274_12995 [Ferrovum myxofaciens]